MTFKYFSGENFSVIITINPMDVSRLPEITFLGPERLVEEYRNTLNSNITEWEPKNGMFSETLKLLGKKSFISQSTASKSGRIKCII